VSQLISDRILRISPGTESKTIIMGTPLHDPWARACPLLQRMKRDREHFTMSIQ
jgi:hypothetical protein